MNTRYALGGGFTYFIEAEDGGEIKIGRTRRDPAKRLAALQTGSPVRLRLMAVLEGADREAEFHRRFADDRLHGEWFTPTTEMLNALLHELRNDPRRENVQRRLNPEFWRDFDAIETTLQDAREDNYHAWERAKASLAALTETRAASDVDSEIAYHRLVRSAP